MAQARKGGRASDAGRADEAADVLQLEVAGCAPSSRGVLVLSSVFPRCICHADDKPA